jgi:hypothetical protein
MMILTNNPNNHQKFHYFISYALGDCGEKRKYLPSERTE